jgi:hypothetical protein
MHYPNMSDPAEFPVVGDEAAQLPQTAVRTLRVDPRHSMKVATAELETALEQLGADMNPASRRQTALLASELIAQVVGRDLDLGNGAAVDLTVRFSPNLVRLETHGPSLPSAIHEVQPEAANGFAEWGQFVLQRLANRWGIDGDDPAILWAEIELA